MDTSNIIDLDDSQTEEQTTINIDDDDDGDETVTKYQRLNDGSHAPVAHHQTQQHMTQNVDTVPTAAPVPEQAAVPVTGKKRGRPKKAAAAAASDGASAFDGPSTPPSAKQTKTTSPKEKPDTPWISGLTNAIFYVHAAKNQFNWAKFRQYMKAHKDFAKHAKRFDNYTDARFEEKLKSAAGECQSQWATALTPGTFARMDTFKNTDKSFPTVEIEEGVFDDALVVCEVVQDEEDEPEVDAAGASAAKPKKKKKKEGYTYDFVPQMIEGFKAAGIDWTLFKRNTVVEHGAIRFRFGDVYVPFVMICLHPSNLVKLWNHIPEESSGQSKLMIYISELKKYFAGQTIVVCCLRSLEFLQRHFEGTVHNSLYRLLDETKAVMAHYQIQFWHKQNMIDVAKFLVRQCRTLATMQLSKKSNPSLQNPTQEMLLTSYRKFLRSYLTGLNGDGKVNVVIKQYPTLHAFSAAASSPQAFKTLSALLSPDFADITILRIISQFALDEGEMEVSIENLPIIRQKLRTRGIDVPEPGGSSAPAPSPAAAAKAPPPAVPAIAQQQQQQQARPAAVQPAAVIAPRQAAPAAPVPTQPIAPMPAAQFPPMPKPASPPVLTAAPPITSGQVAAPPAFHPPVPQAYQGMQSQYHTGYPANYTPPPQMQYPHPPQQVYGQQQPMPYYQHVAGPAQPPTGHTISPVPGEQSQQGDAEVETRKAVRKLFADHGVPLNTALTIGAHFALLGPNANVALKEAKELFDEGQVAKDILESFAVAYSCPNLKHLL